MTDATSGAAPPGSGGNDDEKCPKCNKKKHDKKFRRSKSERKKALLRDADDPDSGLSDTARAFIKKHKGDRVPSGHEVSHEEPLYTKPKSDRCELDTEDNMKTQRKSDHRKRHRRCGDQYHLYPK